LEIFAMVHRITVAALLICLSAFVLPGLAQAPRKARPDRDVEKGEEVNTAKEEAAAADDAKLPNDSAVIMGLLKQRFETHGLSEKVKLKVAIEYFSETSGGKLPMLIDKAAFAAELGADAQDPYEEDVSLPPIPRKMPLNTALHLILSQVGKGQATYLIRQGHIEIVPASHATAKHLLAQQVFESFDQRPLLSVLTDLSGQSGLTINVDPSVGKQAGSLITATFRNTTLEDTLVAVTEMAELKFVVFRNSIYVTSASKVEALEEEEKQRNKKRESLPKIPLNPAKRLEAPAE
jgi:hypothetical protein